MFALKHPLDRDGRSWQLYHANCILATARACTRPCSNNVRFRFHLTQREEEAPIPYGTKRGSHDDTFAGRKFSYITVLCSVYREHIARNIGRRICVKSGTRDGGTCPFFYFGTSQLLCIVTRTGNGCQLSATRTSTAGHGPPAGEFEKARSRGGPS